MADVSNSGTSGSAVLDPDVSEAIQPVRRSKWYLWRRDGKALALYLLDSEVHTYAFSVAANAILSFIPLIVLLYTLSLSVFHSVQLANLVTEMVNYFIPPLTKTPDWITTHLQAAAARQGVQAFSLLMILVACTGIFLPLEVALNQAWGVVKSRNYLMNQLVAFGLAILMVALAMGCVLLSAGQRMLFDFVFLHHTENFIYRGIGSIWLLLTSGLACIVFFFAIYWLLPNRRVPPRHVMRTAVITGLLWLAAKYLFMAVLPHLDLEGLYGPFYVSVGLLFWAYVSGLILFAGAQFSVARFNGKR